MSEESGRRTLWAVMSRLRVALACVRCQILGQRCFVEWDGVVWSVVED